MNAVHGVCRFFSGRWNGDVPVRRVFWWDALICATALNALAGVFGLILLTRGADPALWAAAHFGLLPYNVFLFLAVWRFSEHCWDRRIGIGLWFAGTLLI